MENEKKGVLPMSHDTTLSKNQYLKTADERVQMSGVPYASAIGSIMYAMICTRPDVSYALSVISRYQSDPGLAHWAAVKNILKYLRRTKVMLLAYGGDEELVVNGYTDASFMIDIDDYKSQSGYVFTLNGGAVVSKSFKQNTIADSTTEAEYIVALEASMEAVWIKKFLEEVCVVPSAMNPMALYCDNSGAIAQAREPRSHMKTSKYHIIRQHVEKGFVKVLKVHTDFNVSDLMTKALPRAKHEQHRVAIGVKETM
ncbi:secreted RxLR effector protein 161-like [Aegilops tauschii subsp. strangulata]|uniref:secreted RxLR effector protein 161-like n=1 Tax=Aegilops tauschii subsp. strangulata TaxID=200361 RepID=UPI001ABC258A|nr:secreted RxLR effector protein 161-like [Aegilops tauschii subsp. strangulata]